ncbi:hypothetical protein [uncultured Croceicoccus sp.]|uniref:hypothetical protein n=1 Tax=uncultured Croceicoccus sp. TaxID=1295329 RepID=UPI002622450E|nr:hypothetical protein [uncultured Croceicoccus sp.]
MRGVGLAMLAAAALSACAGPGGGAASTRADDAAFMALPPIAEPGAVAATEIAFARAAREQGQWTAFRDYAADDAILFVPGRVGAREWLRDRPNPPRAADWRPRELWTSCDGSIAVTEGGWQRWDGTQGWFTTVWKRQRDGSYRYVMNHGDTTRGRVRTGEALDAHVAQCPDRDWLPPIALNTVAPVEGDWFGGASDDGTLRWGGRVDPWGGRIVTVDVFDGEEFVRVLHQTVAPPGAGIAREQ